MRNLKKILALVLALVMSMSLVSVAGADYTVDKFSDSDKIAAEYNEAVAVLAGLGLMQGDDRGFRPEDTIKRSEVCVILYRMLTGDAKGEKVAAYAAMDQFADCEGHWAEGYINWCFREGLVAGYNDTTFGPEDSITGYQAMLMMLRAIGWDKNDESKTGDWQTATSKMAKELKWTGGYLGDLSAPAPRQAVAQILFEAMQTAQLTYMPYIGYRGYTDTLGQDWNPTLFAEMYGVYYTTAAQHDEFGRPYHVWYVETDAIREPGYQKDRDIVVATYEYETVAKYAVATSQSQLYKDMGLEKDTFITRLTVNGVECADRTCDVFADSKITGTSTKKNIGAQGRLTEVYKVTNDKGRTYVYEMVMIDEFLAKVKGVTEAQYDEKTNNVIKYATLYLEVYHTEGKSCELAIESKENWEYKVDEYLLINAQTKDATVTSEVAENEALKDVYNIVGAPETIKGKQTWYSTESTHEVAGKTEYDSIRYGLDKATTVNTLEFTWYLDSYKNLIGSDDIATSKDYATITSIIWVESPLTLEHGKAMAWLTDMDGNKTSEEPVQILTIDGKKLNGCEGNNADYAALVVSSSTQYNEGKLTNQALYSVETTATGVKLTSVAKLPGATTKTGVPAITADMNITNETKFLVAYKLTDTTYKTYTGVKNVETYLGGNFYVVDRDDNGHAELVFVAAPDLPSSGSTGGAVVKADTKHVFFAEKDTVLHVKTVLGADMELYYVVSGGLVDGVPGEVTITCGTAGDALLAELKAYQGHVMILTKDGNTTRAKGLAEVTNEVTALTAKTFIVWAGASKSATTTNVQGVLQINGCSYDVKGATIISYDGVENIDYHKDNNDKGQFFLVFSMVGIDEQLVSYIYVTDEAGKTVTTGGDNTGDDNTGDDDTTTTEKTAAEKAMEDLLAAMEALNALLGGSTTGSSAAWATSNAYTDAHKALKAAEKAVTDALQALKDALAEAELTEKYSVELATFDAQLTVLSAKVAVKGKEIAVAAATAALKQYEAAKTAAEVQAAMEQIKLAYGLVDTTGADVSKVLTAEDDSFMDIYTDVVADAAADATAAALKTAKLNALETLKKTIWTIVKDNNSYQTAWPLTKNGVATNATIKWTPDGGSETSVAGFVNGMLTVAQDGTLSGTLNGKTAAEIATYVENLADTESAEYKAVKAIADGFVKAYVAAACQITVLEAGQVTVDEVNYANVTIKLTDKDKTEITTGTNVNNFDNLVFTVAPTAGTVINKVYYAIVTEVTNEGVTSEVEGVKRELSASEGKYTIAASKLTGVKVKIYVTVKASATATFENVATGTVSIDNTNNVLVVKPGHTVTEKNYDKYLKINKGTNSEIKSVTVVDDKITVVMTDAGSNNLVDKTYVYTWKNQDVAIRVTDVKAGMTDANIGLTGAGKGTLTISNKIGVAVDVYKTVEGAKVHDLLVVTDTDDDNVTMVQTCTIDGEKVYTIDNSQVGKTLVVTIEAKADVDGDGKLDTVIATTTYEFVIVLGNIAG